jgi:predicted DCC family thiol-disulfide oxidoreductase YuxK|tara:strand:+ start:58 stop:414 length:357 start_codon:yes stop_codon:yes gene_type:complete
MPIKVFFNDSCKVCRLEINHYKKISNSDLEWVDITNNKQAQLMTSKTQSELLRRLHVIEDGKVISGAAAFLVIWSKIPKYNILYKILKLKLLFFIFHYVYEFVAFFLFLKNKNQLKKN